MTRTRRISSWLLTSLFALAVLPALVGHAAGDPSLVTAAKNDDLQAVRAQIARRVNVNEPARDFGVSVETIKRQPLHGLLTPLQQ